MTIMVDQYGVCDSIHRSVNSHFHLLWYMGDVRSEERGGASVWSLCLLYYVEVFQFLLNKSVMHLGEFIGKEY